MSQNSSVKFDMIFTAQNNIKCLSDNVDNNFTLRNNKIYFKNNFINKTLDTTMLGIYKSKFKISTNNSDLLFGIENSDNSLNISGNYYINTKVINTNSIDFYKYEIDVEVKNIINNRNLYVIDKNNVVYKIPIVYNELCKKQSCVSKTVQSYSRIDFAQERQLYFVSNLAQKVNCNYDKIFRMRKMNNQQNLYTTMRLNPEKFPIISSVKNINLTLPQQRYYSNLWWRKLGTSQSISVNDVWGGSSIAGSEVRYTS